MGIGTKWNESNLNPQKWVRVRNEKAAEMVKEGKDVGVHLDLITWNTVVRPIVSIVSGILLTLGIVLLDWLLGSDLIDVWFGLGFVALFSYLVGMGDKNVEVVPEGRMAMISWLGIPLRVYRQTGEYAWTGKNFRLGRVNVFKEPMTDKDGFFWTDVVQTNIWNVYEADASKRSSVLISNTKTGSEIKANLLLMIRMRDPMAWMRKVDPMMDIGERARMSFRTAISFFTGKDIVSVKNLLTEMMAGNIVLTCFLNKSDGTLVKHSLIRSNGGDPMYESVHFRKKETINDERVKFLAALKRDADQALLANVTHVDGEPLVEERGVKESLEEVMHACGVNLERASVGFISLPIEVVKAANQADAQPYQLTTQMASAEATKAAREILKGTPEDRNDPHFEAEMFLAAASDPDSTVNVMYVGGGGDPLGAKAAAAIVSNSMQKGGKK